MRVLVTGATGFIGTTLCREFHQRGIHVDAVSRVVENSLCERTPGGWNIKWPEGLKHIDYSSYSAVVHLAIPPTQRDGDELCDAQTEAMRRLLEGMADSGSGCTVVFLSSQSASSTARSAYGRGKWRSEDLLRSGMVPHVIVRAGLVVSRSQPAGLFGRLAAIARWLPVIPVPHSTRLQVQPILVDDVASVVMRLVTQPEPHACATIGIALPPRTLPELVRDMCWELRLRRIVLPIPLPVARFMLNGLGKLMPGSRLADHLAGLEGSSAIDPEQACHMTGVQLMPFGLPRANWTATDRLAWEAVTLSRHLFGRDPTRRMIHRYTDAHASITQLSEAPQATIPCCPASGLIAEALERVDRSPMCPLTVKFQALCSLAELEPAFQECFRPERPRPFAAWLSLTRHASALPLIVVGGMLATAFRRLRALGCVKQHE